MRLLLNCYRFTVTVVLFAIAILFLLLNMSIAIMLDNSRNKASIWLDSACNWLVSLSPLTRADHESHPSPE